MSLITIISETVAYVQINNNMYPVFLMRNWTFLYYTFKLINTMNAVKKKSSPPSCPPTPNREVWENAVDSL